MRQIYTGFMNFEIQLSQILLKLNQKRPKFAYLLRKVIKELKGAQVKYKLIYQISNTICGRKIKTRSIWTFRGNVFVKAIF